MSVVDITELVEGARQDLGGDFDTLRTIINVPDDCELAVWLTAGGRIRTLKPFPLVWENIQTGVKESPRNTVEVGLNDHSELAPVEW
jgi:hypothetical protein